MLDKSRHILEYPTIIEQLRDHASSSLGRAKAEALLPSFDFETVYHALQSTKEGVDVLRLKGRVPLGGLHDIRPAIKRCRIGGMLDAAQLRDIADTIYAGRNMKQFIRTCAEDEETEIPIINGWAVRIASLKHLEQAILRCLDEHGDILDTASVKLRSIRNRIRQAEGRIRQKLDQLTKSSSHRGMLQDAIVTVRNDRFCIPVKAEHRHAFGGMVHGQSSSGATVFVEPQAVVAINTELNAYKLEEEQEIERILRELSSQTAEVVDELDQNCVALQELDFIFTKAHYANELQATLPKLNKDGYFKLNQARHPLIPREEIVPISFELGDAYSTMIITGPNTGGKTVTLKTLGLVTLMACSGLYVPAEEGSEVAVVSSVYADIGDEQSIEQSLSTFSSHMTNIVDILKHINGSSLVLLDELGAGTDPTEGAALAMAILDHVHDRGARVVATTHYSELKAYAYSKEGVMNASVEFDVQSLQPTYRLLVGVPGRSNAFSIAKRLGLPEHLIRHARGRVGDDTTRAESMIASLESNRKQAEQEREKAAKLRRDVELLREKLAIREHQLEREKERYLLEAKQQADAHVKQSIAEAEKIMEHLREMTRQSQEVKEHVLIDAKKKLENVGQLTNERSRSQSKKTKRKSSQRLRAGDDVHVHTFGQTGTILEQTSDHQFQVQIGVMKVTVSRDQMEKVIRKQPAYEQTSTTVNTSSPAPSLELDIRGKSVGEALVDIDQYLDQAIVSGFHQVQIIHGKGTGQLRKGVQQFLKRHKRVKSTRIGGAGEGGSGVTVVDLA